MLEHITSCENHYRDNKLVLFFGIICFAISVVGSMNRNPELGFFAVIGLVLLIWYWLTRKNVIIISSPSTKMVINTAGMKRESVLQFINKIEQTKHQRVSALAKGSNVNY